MISILQHLTNLNNVLKISTNSHSKGCQILHHYSVVVLRGLLKATILWMGKFGCWLQICQMSFKNHPFEFKVLGKASNIFYLWKIFLTTKENLEEINM